MKTGLYNIYSWAAILFVVLLPTRSLCQYITIPDVAFSSWLAANGYSSCISGNLLDTTCPAVINARNMDCSNQGISDLTGIKYFINLDTLHCDGNPFNVPLDFPKNLKKVTFENSVYFFVPISLPPALQYLDCSWTQLVGLNNLPASLTYLNCSITSIDSLPPIPDSVQSLYCGSNYAAKLNFSPNSQCTYLDCSGSNSGSLIINILPPHLQYLRCDASGITSLPPFPSTLQTILCMGNPLHQLGTLPASLTELFCDGDSLTSLPALPPHLYYLSCSDNQLTQLPTLDSSLLYLTCENDLLTSLPDFPPLLNNLHCVNNPSLTCLPLSSNLSNLYFQGTGVTCVPYNQYLSGDVDFTTFPRCELTNFNSCPVLWNMRGKVYADVNGNCQYDMTDIALQQVKLMLWSNGQLVQQAFSRSTGDYFFDVDTLGQYSLTIDTTGQSMQVSCPFNGVMQASVSTLDTTNSGLNFGMVCKPGFDLGVTYIAGRFRATDTSVV